MKRAIFRKFLAFLTALCLLLSCAGVADDPPALKYTEENGVGTIEVPEDIEVYSGIAVEITASTSDGTFVQIDDQSCSLPPEDSPKQLNVITQDITDTVPDQTAVYIANGAPESDPEPEVIGVQENPANGGQGDAGGGNGQANDGGQENPDNNEPEDEPVTTAVNLTVNGSINSKGNGIIALAQGEGTSIDIEVTENIVAALDGVEAQATADNSQVSFTAGGYIYADETGLVASATGENSQVTASVDGIIAYEVAIDACAGEGGEVSIVVTGIAEGDQAGIRVEKREGAPADEAPGEVSIVVEETVATGIGTPVETVGYTAEEIKSEDLEIIAYKIEANQNGEIAEAKKSDGNRDEEATQALQSAIWYIIKKEENSNATLTVTGTQQKRGHEVAHEADTVTLKVSVQPGYYIVGAYNVDGQKVALQRDATNGEYYIRVPRGGGVNLAVQVAPIQTDSEEEPKQETREKVKKKNIDTAKKSPYPIQVVGEPKVEQRADGGVDAFLNLRVGQTAYQNGLSVVFAAVPAAMNMAQFTVDGLKGDESIAATSYPTGQGDGSNNVVLGFYKDEEQTQPGLTGLGTRALAVQINVQPGQTQGMRQLTEDERNQLLAQYDEAKASGASPEELARLASELASPVTQETASKSGAPANNAAAGGEGDLTVGGTQQQLLQQLWGAGQTRAVTGAYSKGKNASQLIKNTKNRILNNKTKPVNELDVNSFGYHLEGILNELHTYGTFSFTLTNITSTGLSDSAVNAWNKTYADAINANKSEEEAATLADQALIDTVADYVFLDKGIGFGNLDHLNFDWMNQYVQQEAAGKSGTAASVAVASSKGGTAASSEGSLTVSSEGELFVGDLTVGSEGGLTAGGESGSTAGGEDGLTAGGESGSTAGGEGGLTAGGESGSTAGGKGDLTAGGSTLSVTGLSATTASSPVSLQSGTAAGGESGSTAGGSTVSGGGRLTVGSEGGAAANDNLKNIVDTLPGGGIIISGPGSPAEIAQTNGRDETLVSADSLQDIVTKHFTNRQTELIEEYKAKPKYAHGGETGDWGD